MNVRVAVAAFVLGLVAALTAPARADVMAPDTQQCGSLKEGAACTTDSKHSGKCVKRKCGRLDYSKGTPPTSVQYDCLICEKGAGGCSMGGGAGGAHASLAALALLWLFQRRRARGPWALPKKG